MNILITGANGNMGSAMVEKYLSEGHHVIGTMLSGKHVERFEAQEAFTRLEVNLMEEGPLAEALEKLGKNIHVGIFTVGGFAMGNISNTSLSSLEKMIRLNLYTAFNSAKAVFNHMKGHGEGGRIVLVSSKPGLDPGQGAATLPYTLAKSTIPALAEILNVEGKKEGIVATVIAPGIIDTPPNREAMPDANFGDWVTPEQIADIVFFATAQSGAPLREPVLKIFGNS